MASSADTARYRAKCRKEGRKPVSYIPSKEAREVIDNRTKVAGKFEKSINSFINESILQRGKEK